MKRFLVATAFAMTFVAYSYAAGSANIHDSVNNSQAQAHQMMSSSQDSAIKGSSVKVSDMSPEQRAALAHETVNNGSSPAHQNMAKEHEKMTDAPIQPNNADNTKPQSLSQVNEHEQAAIAHELTKNGQSSISHQQQAEKHRSMITEN